jgi:hypothetical protein
MCENHKRFGNEFRINRRKSAGCTRVVYLCGLFLALVLGLAGSCAIKQVAQMKAENKQLLTQMDQRAKPYLQEANQAVPGIVRRICKPKKLAKLCWYMAVDKIRKSNKAERYLKQQLQPVTNACRKIANVYGIQADTSNTTKNVKELSLYYFFRSGSAASGLALEAVFLKSTMHALGRLLGAAVGKMSASVAAGGACAAADGPMLIGDIFGVAMAAGGTALGVYDLWKIRKTLPKELRAVLYASIDDFHKACREEAMR